MGCAQLALPQVLTRRIGSTTFWRRLYVLKSGQACEGGGGPDSRSECHPTATNGAPDRRGFSIGHVHVSNESMSRVTVWYSGLDAMEMGSGAAKECLTGNQR